MHDLTILVPGAPRYAPGAALPRTRFVPGRHPHPRRDPAGSLHGRPPHAPGLPPSRWRDDASYLLGIDLYHLGYLWESHEALEACWFAAEEPVHRDLLQSLIQLAAAELQRHRGLGAGVRTLATRLSMRLGRVADALGGDAELCGLRVPELRDACRRRFAGALAPGGDPLRTPGLAVQLHLMCAGDPPCSRSG